MTAVVSIPNKKHRSHTRTKHSSTQPSHAGGTYDRFSYDQSNTSTHRGGYNYCLRRWPYEEIVCAPSQGKEWCTDAFAEAWRVVGFGDAEDGARDWFPDNQLLVSSLDDLLEDGVGEAEEEEDAEEVLTVVDGGHIAVSWVGRRAR